MIYKRSISTIIQYTLCPFHSTWLIVLPFSVWSFHEALSRSFPHFHKNSLIFYSLFATLLLVFSILLHELGHAIASGKVLSSQKKILFPFGAITINGICKPLSIATLIPSLTGPLSSGLTAALCYLISLYGSEVAWPLPLVTIFNYLFTINCIIALCNIIPFYPLDFGTPVRFALSEWNISQSATNRFTCISGICFFVLVFFFGLYAIITGYYVIGIWLMILSILFKMALELCNQRYSLIDKLYGEKVACYMRTNPITVHPSISIETFMTDYYSRYQDGIYPVVEYSTIQGALTLQQIRTVPMELWKHHTIREIAKPCTKVNSVTPETDIVDVLKTIMHAPDHKLLVIKDDILKGIITLKDLLPFFILKLDLTTDVCNKITTKNFLYK